MSYIFSYGSNSIYQLRGRVNNNNLISSPAYIENYKKIFRGYSSGWKGGVASLVKKKFIKTYGIIVFLSEDEILKLDSYEIGYHKEELICIKLDEYNNELKLKCYVYIANDNTWISPPSQQYLVAIKVMLNEYFSNCKHSSFIIIASFINNKTINITKWVFPKDIYDLRLESFIVLVNSKQNKYWAMPMIINDIVYKLNNIKIQNLIELDNSLTNNYSTINKRLKNHNFLSFSQNTILLFQEILYKNKI